MAFTFINTVLDPLTAYAPISAHYGFYWEKITSAHLLVFPPGFKKGRVLEKRAGCKILKKRATLARRRPSCQILTKFNVSHVVGVDLIQLFISLRVMTSILL